MGLCIRMHTLFCVHSSSIRYAACKRPKSMLLPCSWSQVTIMYVPEAADAIARWYDFPFACFNCVCVFVSRTHLHWIKIAATSFVHVRLVNKGIGYFPLSTHPMHLCNFVTIGAHHSYWCVVQQLWPKVNHCCFNFVTRLL